MRSELTRAMVIPGLRCIGLGFPEIQKKKAFFFEKKKQKTFDCFGFGLSG
jgi:hypothetical protein